MNVCDSLKFNSEYNIYTHDLTEDTSFEEGEIEPSKPGEEIRQTPLTLPDGYEWCSMDLSDETQVETFYIRISPTLIPYKSPVHMHPCWTC